MFQNYAIYAGVNALTTVTAVNLYCPYIKHDKTTSAPEKNAVTCMVIHATKMTGSSSMIGFIST
jgi:hypothetical protein